MKPAPGQRLALRERPAQPFVMRQRWQDLLFLHWRCDPDVVQATLPPGLHVDTFDGCAWVAIVPFLMRRIRPRFCPRVPGISDFLEMNLRTYVHDDQGRPGVWFYSLECDLPLAVWIGRTLFHLPYQHADMSITRATDDTIRYTSQRRGDSRVSEFIYRLEKETRHAGEGSLEFFLAERYLLYANSPHGLRTGRVHHTPYPLCAVALGGWDTRIFELNGLPAPQTPPDHVIGSPGVDVSVYPLGGLAAISAKTGTPARPQPPAR